jgi:hypothetical protein
MAVFCINDLYLVDYFLAKSRKLKICKVIQTNLHFLAKNWQKWQEKARNSRKSF